MGDIRRMTFPADVTWLASLRDFADRAASDLGAQVDPDSLAVIVGELTANAAVHQRGEAELSLATTEDGGVEVSVSDPDSTVPRSVDHSPWDVDGHRGIQLIAALAEDWGVESAPSGKRVWARLGPRDRQPRHLRMASPPA